MDVDTELCKNNSYKMIVNSHSFLIDGRSMLTLLLMGSLNGVELGGSDDDSDGRLQVSLPSNMADTTIQYSSSSSSVKSII